MKALKYWPTFCIVFVLANIRAVHADTGIDGAATTSSSFTMTGPVFMSSLTVSGTLVVSTITAVSSFTTTSANIKGVTPTIAGTSGIINTTDSLSTMLGKLINMRIVQIVQSTSSTNFSTTSNSFQTTNLSASITPIASSSKILVIANGRLQLDANNHVSYATLTRNGSNLGGSLGMQQLSIALGTTGAINTPCTLTYLDTPSTTSSTTYAVQIKNDDGATAVEFLVGNQTGVIDLVELAVGD